MKKVLLVLLIVFFMACPLAFAIESDQAEYQDIDCKDIDPCLNAVDPCGCKSLPPAPVEIQGPDVATLDSVYSAVAGTGRAPYEFGITEGEIDTSSGKITEVPECPCTATVAIKDACSQFDTMAVEFKADTELAISGSSSPVVGDFYAATGGSGDYVFSFQGGEIDAETGEVLSVISCGGPLGNGAIGSVSVTDKCQASASMEVKLPGGEWVLTDSYEGSYNCYQDEKVYVSSCVSYSGNRKLVQGWCFTRELYPRATPCYDMPVCCEHCYANEIGYPCKYPDSTIKYQQIRQTNYEVYEWICTE